MRRFTLKHSKKVTACDPGGIKTKGEQRPSISVRVEKVGGGDGASTGKAKTEAFLSLVEK